MFQGKVIATRHTPNGMDVACIKIGELYGDLPLLDADARSVKENDAVQIEPVLRVTNGRLESLLRVRPIK